MTLNRPHLRPTSSLVQAYEACASCRVWIQHHLRRPLERYRIALHRRKWLEISERARGEAILMHATPSSTFMDGVFTGWAMAMEAR